MDANSKSELVINGKDALGTFGVRMGKGFLDAILAFPPLKANVENQSRLRHGKYVIVQNQRYDSREVTLSFTIQGTGATIAAQRASLERNKALFRSELEIGKIALSIPPINSDIYRLRYTGKSATHSMNRNRTICTITLKLEETNPNNRGAEDDGTISVVTDATPKG